MGEALYRRYRSKKLNEVVGQEHITSTLSNALKTGRISHAYLFTGPKGVGKTSIARILAHEVNNLPYTEQNHLDIIEIDAASNRRIDEIRDIRDKVHIAPTSARYKVYIIDEVHMLTKEAFNALLKTLEEPPEHVIFILATTEAHKLPETIVSRTQRYTFKSIDQAKMIEHLRQVAKKEHVHITDDAIELIAAHSGGGMRDALSMLDQLSAKADEISVTDVEHMLGIAPKESITLLANLLNNATPSELVTFLDKLETQGVSAVQIAHQLADHLRSQLISQGGYTEQTLHLLEELLTVANASNPERRLELILLHQVINNTKSVVKPQIASTTTDTIVNPVEDIESKKPALKTETEDSSPKKVSQTTAAELKALILPEQWQKVLHAVKQRHNTLYGIVRMAKPLSDENGLILCFTFPFHQKRMNESKNKQLIQDVISDTTGLSVVINCVVSEETTTPQEATETKQNTSNSATLGTITEIFGGGEVLES